MAVAAAGARSSGVTTNAGHGVALVLGSLVATWFQAPRAVDPDRGGHCWPAAAGFGYLVVGCNSVSLLAPAACSALGALALGGRASDRPTAAPSR